MISRLIRITVETGAVTATSAILELILFRSMDNNIHLVIAMMLCKIYSNAFMASLNSRTGSALVQPGSAQNESSMQWNSFGHIFNETNSTATVVRLQKSTHVSTSPAMNDGSDKGPVRSGDIELGAVIKFDG